MLKLGYYQYNPLFGQIESNAKKIITTLKTARADLIVLPELAFTGYYFRNRDELKSLAEDPHKSPTIDLLTNLCKEQDFYLVTGFAEKQHDKYFNSSLLIGPQGIEHTYRKLHLFNEEKNWFDPGDTPLQVTNVRGANIGMMVCFDWIFPEVCRTLSVLGADIICHPSNLVLDFCQQTMLSRCLENVVFAVTANRSGSDNRPHGSVNFTGKSQIAAPKGVLLNRASSEKDELFITEVDLNLARDKNITALNNIMQDRRPQYYKPLTLSTLTR